MALLPNLSGVHAVFHVSKLWKYTPDPTYVVDWGELVVDADETFEEGPIRIMDSRDQVLRGIMETWEHKDTICTNYPFLFEDESMFFSHLILK